jgi:hypothetical protein
MAIVANLAGSQPLDKSYCHPNRSNAGEPNTGVTPEYAGEIVLDTTNNTLWKAITLANNSWVMITPV